MRLLLAILCTVVLAVPANASEACLPRGKPVVWSVSDADTTIYLVGTVHRLREGEYAPPPVFLTSRDIRIAAFEAQPMSVWGTLRAAFRARSGRDLEDALNVEDWDRLQRLASRYGLPRVTLQRLDPFLLAGALQEKAARSNQRENAYGADTVLKTLFDRDGVETRYLEDPRQLFDLILGIGYEAKVDYLIGTMNLLESERPWSQIDSWLDGDECALLRQAEAISRHADENAAYREIHVTLVTDRNRRFARQIEGLLEVAGQHVVAIGAAHFYGPVNIRELLENSGHPVVEVQ